MNFGNETINRQKVPAKLFFAFIFTMVLLLVCQTTCHATTVVLQWDAETDPAVAGYKVYYKADSSVQPFTGSGATQGASPINVNKLTTATIGGLDPAHAYYFAVTAYNASGVESAYSNLVSVPENMVAPTISIGSPTNNALVSGTVSVTASASDNVGVTKVDFYVNGTLQTTDTSTPYLYSWNTSGIASGTYTLMAKAYDAAGNVGQSSTVSVKVVNDTTAPVISLTAPDNNTTVSGTVSVTATASDNVGVSKVEFYVDGVLSAAVNTSPSSFNWNTIAVTKGSHSLSAKAYDAAGNVGTSNSAAVFVDNTVPDTTAPVVSSFNMPSTATALTVAVTRLSATDTIGVTGYLITTSATSPAASAFGWMGSAPTSVTANAGSNTFYAWAKDAAGNVSAGVSQSVTITLSDTTAPTVSISAPAGNAIVNGIVSVTAAVGDNVGLAKVEFFVNGLLKATDTVSPYNYSWDTNTVVNGSYNLTAKAYDAVGNVSTSSAVAVMVNNIATQQQTILPGDINGDGIVDVSDALLALQFAIGNVQPSSDELKRGDIAPLINGVPVPNSIIDTGDAIVILSIAAGNIVL